MRLTISVLGLTVLDVSLTTDDTDTNEPTEPWPFGFTSGGQQMAHTEIAGPADVDTTVRR